MLIQKNLSHTDIKRSLQSRLTKNEKGSPVPSNIVIDSIHFPNSLVYVNPTEEGVCEQVFIRVLLSITFIPTHIKSEKKTGPSYKFNIT